MGVWKRDTVNMLSKWAGLDWFSSTLSLRSITSRKPSVYYLPLPPPLPPPLLLPPHYQRHHHYHFRRRRHHHHHHHHSKKDWCSSSILDIYVGDVWFKSWLGYELYWLRSLTHWHTQTSVRRQGSLGPLIHSWLWDAIQRPTQHHSTTGVCIEVNKN